MQAIDESENEDDDENSPGATEESVCFDFDYFSSRTQKFRKELKFEHMGTKEQIPGQMVFVLEAEGEEEAASEGKLTQPVDEEVKATVDPDLVTLLRDEVLQLKTDVSHLEQSQTILQEDLQKTK